MNGRDESQFLFWFKDVLQLPPQQKKPPSQSRNESHTPSYHFFWNNLATTACCPPPPPIPTEEEKESTPGVDRKRRFRRISSKDKAKDDRECAWCHATNTPQWRRYSQNNHIFLCNACGIQDALEPKKKLKKAELNAAIQDLVNLKDMSKTPTIPKLHESSSNPVILFNNDEQAKVIESPTIPETTVLNPLENNERSNITQNVISLVLEKPPLIKEPEFKPRGISSFENYLNDEIKLLSWKNELFLGLFGTAPQPQSKPQEKEKDVFSTEPKVTI